MLPSVDLFFLHLDGLHPPLHSFPTRRSSDLAGFGGGGMHGKRSLEGTFLGERLPCIPDRKSTRLNSSHTVISYAVFCLKKKNGDRTRYTSAPRTTTQLPYGSTIRPNTSRRRL